MLFSPSDSLLITCRVRVFEWALKNECAPGGCSSLNDYSTAHRHPHSPTSRHNHGEVIVQLRVNPDLPACNLRRLQVPAEDDTRRIALVARLPLGIVEL